MQHPFAGIIVPEQPLEQAPQQDDQALSASADRSRRSFFASALSALGGTAALLMSGKIRADEPYAAPALPVEPEPIQPPGDSPADSQPLPQEQPQMSTRALGEEGGANQITTYALGEEGSGERPSGPPPSTTALGEEGSAGQPTTYALGEEGSAGRPTTYALGEEGSSRPVTTYALGEEGSGRRVTTYAFGEEGCRRRVRRRRWR